MQNKTLICKIEFFDSRKGNTYCSLSY